MSICSPIGAVRLSLYRPDACLPAKNTRLSTMRGGLWLGSPPGATTARRRRFGIVLRPPDRKLHQLSGLGIGLNLAVQDLDGTLEPLCCFERGNEIRERRQRWCKAA